MTAKLCCTIFIILGCFLVLGFSLRDISDLMTKPFQHRLTRKQRIQELTQKPHGRIRSLIEDTRVLLESIGGQKTLESYQWGTCLIALTGFAIGVLLDNLLLALVLTGGSVLLPLAMIYIRSGEYQRSLTASLESGMGIVTNAYIASGDFIQAVEESLHLLPEPLIGWFRTFLTQTQLVDASMDRALEALRRQCSNRWWQDWCGILIQCQVDRQLRYALPGIVERLGESRRVQMEVDTTIQRNYRDYALIVLIVLSSVPLMGVMMPEWCDALLYTLPGKITLALVLAAVLATSVWVARANQSIDAKERRKHS